MNLLILIPKPNGSHVVVFFSSGLSVMLRLSATLTALTLLLFQSWLRTWQKEPVPAWKSLWRYNNCAMKPMMCFGFNGCVSIVLPYLRFSLQSFCCMPFNPFQSSSPLQSTLQPPNTLFFKGHLTQDLLHCFPSVANFILCIYLEPVHVPEL